MKLLIILVAILSLSYFSTAQTVVHVIDGDTYRMLDKGKLVTVRLANVDAPELNQYYGKYVKACVSKLILGKTLELEFFKNDRYGRMICNFKVEGKSFDSLLVSNGWAWHYPAYSHNIYLSKYQARAMRYRKGMWKCNYNIKPWIWRSLNKNEQRRKEMCR